MAATPDSRARWETFVLFRSYLRKFHPDAQYACFDRLFDSCPYLNVRTMLVGLLKDAVSEALTSDQVFCFNSRLLLELVKKICIIPEEEVPELRNNYLSQVTMLLYLIRCRDEGNRIEAQGWFADNTVRSFLNKIATKDEPLAYNISRLQNAI